MLKTKTQTPEANFYFGYYIAGTDEDYDFHKLANHNQHNTDNLYVETTNDHADALIVIPNTHTTSTWDHPVVPDTKRPTKQQITRFIATAKKLGIDTANRTPTWILCTNYN